MGAALGQWRQRIREYKNDWVQTYFRYRIESSDRPYGVAFRSKPYRFLLVLSHMRSGSSLLTHLLTTNPEVIGYGETHTNYASAHDFKGLLKKVYWQAQEFRTLGDVRNLRMDHQYVMDKVLHNKKFLDHEFLKSEQVYGIFLLREPERSLASIADLKPHWNQQDTLDYYSERMARLVDYARLINDPQRLLVVTYEQILDNTPQVLQTLQQFLHTQASFTEEYKVFKTTGMKGVGDSKGNIKAGKIVRSQRQLTQTFPPELVEQAKRIHSHCQTELMQHCQSISHPSS
ncbi:sulfotransferase family protein [Leptolyngbya cf. ectocarpi LEGE 11479]|uniref:Sulfotransferase family protein n=1 Tax=Leptolyngbya cf. ectocarpi LEGE 11479 TaxID=1828722 RepID=A0A929FA49_LEPEC|nr:sulfotransferase family protein [Leptolyngbya ectocarpi]MBE9069741.1 sulfotransferase family protein [Leptolyngbya cf. ectocarpi LEGE 11479]